MGKRPLWLRKKISEATKIGMAKMEVKEKLIALKGNGNGFKKGKLNPSYGKTGIESPAWKRNYVGITAKHGRIKNLLGKAIRCENCGTKNKVQWSNKDHKYKDNKNDWQQLCPKCHTKYDRKNNNKNFNELKLNKKVLLKLYNSGISCREMQRILKIGSHHTIVNYLKKYKII